MSRLAIIGGSGLTEPPNVRIKQRKTLSTPWRDPSAPILIAEAVGKEILFLPRHGDPHTIPPHRINHRANIWALKQMQVTDVIAVNAVGGITTAMAPQRIAVPEQIIDYSHNPAATFFEEPLQQVTHVDFTRPYTESLRRQLITAAGNIDIVAGGVYGATHGPRLETAAEIIRMERDGCDMVGMTGMPEAALAREQAINYACCALVVNRAAGKSSTPITMQTIQHNLAQGMASILKLLENFIAQY